MGIYQTKPNQTKEPNQMTKKLDILGKFNSLATAESFCEHTVKMSAIILGDDEKFWVVNLRVFEQLLKAGYSRAD
jgi:hypothetical protein